MAQVFCHKRGVGGLDVPGPSPGGVLSTWSGQREEAGIWQMASVWGSWGRLATRWCLEELFDLLRPFHVICPRLLACQGLDNVLQASPEAHLLQRVVEPACSRDRAGGCEEGLNGRATGRAERQKEVTNYSHQGQPLGEPIIQRKS